MFRAIVSGLALADDVLFVSTVARSLLTIFVAAQGCPMQPFPRQALVTGIKPFNYVHDWRTTEHRMCKREGSQPMELPIAAWNSELPRIVHLINPTTKCGTQEVSFAGHAELVCMELQIQ